MNKKTLNKKTLLEEANKLNMPGQTCMKTKEDLEKAIKDTMSKYKESIFSVDSPLYTEYLNEIRKQIKIDDYTYCTYCTYY